MVIVPVFTKLSTTSAGMATSEAPVSTTKFRFITPFTVPRDRYGDAIALVSITFDMSVLFGYAVGGGMIALVGARTALMLNAISFLLSAMLLLGINAARNKPIEGPPGLE